MSFKKLNKIASAADKFAKTGKYDPETEEDSFEQDSEDKRPSGKQFAAMKAKSKGEKPGTFKKTK